MSKFAISQNIFKDENTIIFRLKKTLSPTTKKIPYLKILVLFVSRVRGDTHAKSDWDFAALYDE
ncbi:MAG: hypothetical protein F6K48_02365 [Okeania sp. SIO3H1]|uniref:hypothetical protein n=1 Tax=Okeania sp. SIO1I7 TaxID=2607772 RepID=UPI0013CD0F4B|nr:hypothetical protein [Okeania sp. SIO1I7]NEN87822.1 hypothetical protein [Okeania sp. SIO3H1]